MEKEKINTKVFARDDQITFHNIRMFIQIMDKVIVIVGILFLVSSFCLIYSFSVLVKAKVL